MISLERQWQQFQSLEEGAAERASTVPRPVELMVVRWLVDGKRYAWDWDMPTRDDAKPPPMMRYCVECRKKHPVTDFPISHHVHDGLAYACRRARARKGRVTWRRMYEVA